jgi:WS/DGAT/MGAT family acyltransferase
MHGLPAPLALPGRMAPTDALFWYAESALPVFRPIIGGLYALERAPSPGVIANGLDLALHVVPRLRERVVEVPLQLGLPEWVADPHFDRDYHLRHLSLPAPGSRRQLLDLTAQILATPLDRQRPLWEAYWIDGVEQRKAALFLKMHHCMVDGVGAIAILNALTQTDPRAELPELESKPRRRREPPGPTERLLRLALDDARASTWLALRAAFAPVRVAAHPARFASELARTLRGLRGMLQDLTKPPIRDPLAASSSGLSRRLDVMEISLERLGKIKAPLGVTINDVVLTVLAGALGRYHRERRVRVEALHCMVPMNLRGRDERDALGNRVGVFGIVLPVAERGVASRLERIVAQTRAAKSDRRGAAAPLFVQAATLLPGGAFRWMARRSLGRVNVACTNVPGVKETRWIGEARVEAIFPFASVVEGTPLVVALLSYAGTMDVGIDTDPEAIPDPQRITELLAEGFDEVEALATRTSRPRRGPRRARG